MAEKVASGMLASQRKILVADRVKDKQDKSYVEEKKRELLTFRRVEGRILVSGDRTRCRKLKEDKQTADIIARMFLEVDGEEEQEEHGFVTDDDIFLPKLFCQIGDRANGWNYKNIREATELYLSVLGGGKGGRLSLGDKTKPRPAWFDKNVWPKFKSVATASMEENIDIIKEIFRYYNLNPKVHCIFPVEEEEQVEEVMFGDVGEEIVGEGEGEEVLEEGEAQFEELLAMMAKGTAV